MKVQLETNENGNGHCFVNREPGDPKFRNGTWGSGESRLLYHVKQILNRQGYNFIKKRMWKDGHMVSEQQLYLRERKPKNGRLLGIYSHFWQIRGAEEDFNKNGEVMFTVQNLVERDVK